MDPFSEQITHYILVAGPSGVGKSSFVNIASGSDLPIGDDLNSCTADVAVTKPFQLSGSQVQLIDTPGFDDSEVSDTDILQRIALHLETMYRQGCLLKGILFLHRISDVRATGTARKSLRMLQELCGDEALQNLVLVTTFWGNVPQDVGEARERQLVSEETLFKPLLDRGAKIRRHKDTERSAHEILQLLLDKGRQRFPLKIQKELVDERKDILETAAGIALDKELALQAQQHKAELERVKEEIAQALAQKDLESQRELEEIEREYKAKLKKAISDRQTISTDYAKKRAEQDDSEREFTYTPLQQTVEIPPVPLRGPQQPNVDKKKSNWFIAAIRSVFSCLFPDHSD